MPNVYCKQFSEKILNKSIKIYSKALKESGFTDDLKYAPNVAQQLENSEDRKRKKRKFGSTHPIQKTEKLVWLRYF